MCIDKIIELIEHHLLKYTKEKDGLNNIRSLILPFTNNFSFV